LQPPRTALILMDRLGVDRSVIGDLIERFHQGRPRRWFWRQACGALVASMTQDIRTHPFRAFGALLLALVLWRVNIAAVRQLSLTFVPDVARAIMELVPLSRPMQVFIGGAVTVAVSLPGWFLLGWVFSRLQQPGLVLAFLAITLASVLPHYARQVGHALADPMFAPYRVVHFSAIALWLTTFTTAVLAGALSGTRPQQPALPR
jgi:hypothetical protein